MDVEDFAPLTPAMFLHDNETGTVEDLDVIDNTKFNKRFRYQQKLREDLRQRFRAEYLSQLLQKPNKKHNEYKMQVGDVVMIGSDGKKRMDWPLARIINMYPGKDGAVRVVRLKTASGELVRPVQRVYPLEIHERYIQQEPQPMKANSQDKQEQRLYKTSKGRIVKLPQRLCNDFCFD